MKFVYRNNRNMHTIFWEQKNNKPKTKKRQITHNKISHIVLLEQRLKL